MNKIRPFVPKFKKITQFQVHFDKDGNMLHYHSRFHKPAHEEANAVFYDKLKYNGYSRFSSTVHILFVSDKSGRKFSMFISDFNDIMRANLFNGQFVQGNWCYTKKGQVQGVRYFFDPPTEI